MNYDEILRMLNEGDIFPKKEIYVDEMEERHVKALIIYCPPIISDKKLSYVRGIVGAFARITYFPNQQEIIIEL